MVLCDRYVPSIFGYKVIGYRVIGCDASFSLKNVEILFPVGNLTRY